MNLWIKLQHVRSIKYDPGMLCLLDTVQKEVITKNYLKLVSEEFQKWLLFPGFDSLTPAVF